MAVTHAARLFAAAGAVVSVINAASGDAFDAGRQVLGEIVRAGPPGVRAAAFANDHLACGALLEAVQRGVRVLQQPAMLGFGDFAISRQLSPAMSSVQLQRHAIGVETARSVLNALRRGLPAVPVSLPWALVVRGSTASN